MISLSLTEKTHVEEEEKRAAVDTASSIEEISVAGKTLVAILQELLLLTNSGPMTPGKMALLRERLLKREDTPEAYEVFLRCEEEINFLSPHHPLLNIHNKAQADKWHEEVSKTQAADTDEFTRRFDRHLEAVKKRYAEKGRKLSYVKIYEACYMDKNAWDRLRKAKGRGKQYHDLLRSLCVLLDIDFGEVSGLLALADQALDYNEPLDYWLACYLLAETEEAGGESFHISPQELNRYLSEKLSNFPQDKLHELIFDLNALDQEGYIRTD